MNFRKYSREGFFQNDYLIGATPHSAECSVLVASFPALFILTLIGSNFDPKVEDLELSRT